MSPPNDLLAGFGPNERALLERVPTRALRRMAAGMVRTKERLQFTGWLQYVIPLGPTLVLTLLAGLVALVGFPRAAAVTAVLPALLLATAAFDIITLRFNIRPNERRPATRDDLDIFELMRVRRSCRSYQARAMSDDDREAVLALARKHIGSTPTFGPGPVRLEYIHGPMTVWPVVNATEFLVAIVPKPYDRRSVIDIGRTLQKVVLDATRLGLGTCWIGPGADHASIRKFLGDRFDETRDELICVCAVGYASRFVPLFVRAFSRMTGNRKPLEELFFKDAALTEPASLDAPGLSPFAPSFEGCRWGPSSYNGQTTRAVLRTNDDGTLAGVDFCAATTSRYYAPVALGIWCANWELGVQALGLEGDFVALPPAEGDIVAPRHDVSWGRTPRRA